MVRMVDMTTRGRWTRRTTRGILTLALVSWFLALACMAC